MSNMSLATDLKVLYHLALSPIKGDTHRDRLENFYQGQAGAYDSFRERLLKGRGELLRELPFPERANWLDMGGGTGANLEFIAERIPTLGNVVIVDLSKSLLEVAQKRITERSWTNVRTEEADVTTFTPTVEPVDVVTFSYSLTMIPDWFAAVERAYQILRPGGLIGVVDFYVGRKYPEAQRSKHGWWTRTFWTTWFAMDNVFLSPDHLPYLCRRFEPVSVRECRARVPYVPLGKVPYYQFIGRKAVAGG